VREDSRRPHCFGLELWSSFAGKEEREDGSVVDGMLPAAERETAVVAMDDSGGDPEAESGTVELLGGVEGLEDA